jgi:hypothetical protein
MSILFFQIVYKKEVPCCNFLSQTDRQTTDNKCAVDDTTQKGGKENKIEESQMLAPINPSPRQLARR